SLPSFALPSRPCLRLLLFFFPCPPPHRDLHSFPTRRSSDLRLPDLLRPASSSAVPRQRNPLPDFFSFRNLRSGNPVLSFPLQKRSEEHTSELQSRFDLVCRLLLEKKKKNETNYQYLKQT